MKRCPTCYQSYEDDTLRFCLQDGAILADAADSEATRVLPSESMAGWQATEVWRSPPVAVANPRQPYKATYTAVAIIALVICGGLVWFLLTRMPSADQTATDIRSAQQLVSANSTPSEVRGKRTESTVQDLIAAWARAQNEKDIRRYASCYAAEFQGLKRTKSGRVYSYDFNGWMKDRWNMIKVAVGLNLEVKNLRITLERDYALVEFDQYYRSVKYSDWGPKVMRVTLAPGAEPKISYEELKASNPL